MLRRLLPIVLSAVLLLACRAQPRTMQVEIAVGGMVCDSCVQGITYEVGRLEGVQSVVVDLEGGKATVVYTEGEIEVAALEQTIEKIGYTAEPAEPTALAAE